MAVLASSWPCKSSCLSLFSGLCTLIQVSRISRFEHGNLSDTVSHPMPEVTLLGCSPLRDARAREHVLSLHLSPQVGSWPEQSVVALSCCLFAHSTPLWHPAATLTSQCPSNLTGQQRYSCIATPFPPFPHTSSQLPFLCYQLFLLP